MPEPGILARGPWTADQVTAAWSDEQFEPAADHAEAADQAIAELRERSSPSHDGLAARLSGYSASNGELQLQLQPVRWSLRLVEGNQAESISTLCVTRDAEGRWLAGRRASWVATWAGRWALGAGGAVEVGENPAETLTRELEEEWSLVPERVSVEGLFRLPTGLILLVGLAWVPDATQTIPDHEHDAHAWWPADPADWPDEADAPLRMMAGFLTAS